MYIIRLESVGRAEGLSKHVFRWSYECASSHTEKHQPQVESPMMVGCFFPGSPRQYPRYYCCTAADISAYRPQEWDRA